MPSLNNVSIRRVIRWREKCRVGLENASKPFASQSSTSFDRELFFEGKFIVCIKGHSNEETLFLLSKRVEKAHQ